MKKLRSIMVLTAVATVLSTFAMPAYPGKRLVKMPDGSLREAYIRGDEYLHWLEAPSGERLTNPTSTIARPLENTANKFVQNSPWAANALASTSRPMLVEGTFPTKGKHKLLAVLVDYANTAPTHTQNEFHALMNQNNYGGIGSFRDYYLQQSYGQLDLTTTVTRWVKLKGNKSYYSDNVQEIIHEALTALDPEINFKDFDNDGDGMLDGLLIIHQGGGYEASGDATDIWSHSGVVYGMQFDGVTLNRYTIQPELFVNRAQKVNRMTGIGVICHEFGHNLGALDYYDTDYSTNLEYGGTGIWDLMASGGWNGPEGYGEAPAPFMMWQKEQFGWVKPQVLTTTEHISDMPASGSMPFCYRLNTSIDGDYYYLENRQEVSPWDAYCPGHGLLVSHAIESIIRDRMMANTINARYPQGFYIVAGNTGKDPMPERPDSYGTINVGQVLYGGTGRATSLSDETLPSCRSLDGRHAFAALEHIQETETGTIAFDFIKGKAPARPENLTATVHKGLVTLNWDFLSETEEIPTFTVYRDADKIASTKELTYVDTEANSHGIITYSVDATYADGMRSAYSVTTTRLPINKASDLAYTTESEGVKLTWKQPNELARCVDNLKYTSLEHVSAELSFAHRFRVDDLLPFVGYKVRSISFIPNQLSTTAKFEVCVWRTEPGKNAPELISNREVKEFSPAYKKQVVLVEQPVIESGYEYWIGVHMICSSNYAQLVCDQSELIDGYGNWISYGGTTWQRDPAAMNNYVLSASVVAPSQQAEPVAIPEYTEIDPTIDFYYPLGYNVYVDDSLYCTTTATSANITLPQDGAHHVFSVTSLYKGNNESRALTISTDPESVAQPVIRYNTNAPSYDITGRRTNNSSRGVVIQSGKCLIR